MNCCRCNFREAEEHAPYCHICDKFYSKEEVNRILKYVEDNKYTNCKMVQQGDLQVKLSLAKSYKELEEHDRELERTASLTFRRLTGDKRLIFMIVKNDNRETVE